MHSCPNWSTSILPSESIIQHFIPSVSLAEAWLQTMDPFAIRISGNFGVRWYGLAYAAGFFLAYFVARVLVKRQMISLSPQQVGDYIIACILGVLIGGRLGYVSFYNPSGLWAFTDSFPFWEVLAINHGGMASHGGMIGVILAMVCYGRRHRFSTLYLFDLSALLVPFGLLFGRLANFVNGELRGVPCDPNFPLAVKFPQEITDDWTPDLMARAVNAADALGLTRHEWLNIVDHARLGEAEALATLQYWKHKLVESVQSGNQAVIETVRPMLTTHHPSQLYQAFAEGIVLGTCLWALWWFVFRKRRLAARHGLVAVAFLIIYGILRIVTEIWRLPDEGLGRTLGLSRGQWLSCGMIAGGVALWSILLLMHPRRPAQAEVKAGVE